MPPSLLEVDYPLVYLSTHLLILFMALKISSILPSVCTTSAYMLSITANEVISASI